MVVNNKWSKSLVWSIVLAGVILLVLTTSLCWAAFARTLSNNDSKTILGKMYSTAYVASTVMSNVGSACAANDEISIDTTDTAKGNATTNTNIPVVLRAKIFTNDGVAQFNYNVGGLSTQWTLQTNGWYYYNSAVGFVNGTSLTTKYLLATCTTPGTNVRVIIGMMQYSESTAGGFRVEWAPGNGKLSDTDKMQLHDSTTIDGKTLTSYQGNVLAIFAERNGAVAELGTANIGTAGNIFVIAGETAVGGATLGQVCIKDGTNIYKAEGPVQIYNNSRVKARFVIRFTLEIYDYTYAGDVYSFSNKTSPSYAIQTDTVAMSTGWLKVTDNTASTWVYTQDVEVGGYVTIMEAVATLQGALATSDFNGKAVNILATAYSTYDYSNDETVQPILSGDTNTRDYIKTAERQTFDNWVTSVATSMTIP